MGDGSGTQTGLVGEDAAGEALTHGDHDGVAKDTAAHSLKAECGSEDGAESSGDVRGAQDDDADTGGHVEHGHEGNQERGDLADALGTAQNHDADDDGQQHAGELRLQAEQAVHGAGDLAGLSDVADTEGGQTAQNGEDDSQGLPALAQTVLDVVHGAALIDTLGVLLAELHGQDDLGVLGAHTEESGDPHPEHGAGAAHEDGAGDAGDVAGADGTGQSGTDCLEGAQVFAGVIFLLGEQGTQSVLHDEAEPADLDPAGAEGQEDAGADQKRQHDGAPHETVDGRVYVGDHFEHKYVPFSTR